MQSASESKSFTHRIREQQGVLKVETPKIDDLSVNRLLSLANQMSVLRKSKMNPQYSAVCKGRTHHR